MTSGYERLPQDEIEVSLEVLARMLRMADAHTDTTPLIEERALSKSDHIFLSNYRYCVGLLSRNIAPAAFADYQAAVKAAMSTGDDEALGHIVAPPEQSAFFGGVLAGINAGWHQFGDVVSLFPALGEIADLTGIGRDFRPVGYGQAAWVEEATLSLADFGVRRFSGMEPYHERVQLALSPTGEYDDYVRRGIGLGMLIYEEATKFHPQP